MEYKIMTRRIEVGGQIAYQTERMADQCAICGIEGGTVYCGETDTMVCPSFITLYETLPLDTSWEALLAAHREERR
jgi:hypothetical protein